MIKDPLDLLKTYLNENVCAKIKTGEMLEGKLVGFDEYHNILLIIENVPKFIRGEVLVFIGEKL